MNRFLPILFISLLIPASALAANTPASFSAARSILTESPSPGNVYAAGASVVMTAPVAGDFSAIGGSITTAAPVAGDVLLLAGSLSSRAPIAGDLRVAGGSITIEKPVAGDLVAFGLSVYDSGRAGGSIFIVALNTSLTNGASGPVTIYGNNISLAGDFTGNVKVVASGRVALAPNTTIHGALSYEAPEKAIIPASATIVGDITYRDVSYLPNAGTSRALAFISVGFFLFVRILGALILAGLLAGLFPRLAEVITERAYTARLRAILLTMLLGFAVLAATPILLMLLALTFVGVGVALLVFIVYALVVFLALLYSGILLGGIFARRYARRETARWYDGVFGMLALSFIALVPFIGPLAMLLLTTFSTGALLLVFFNFAFPREGQTSELL
ncbi:MAG: hypothetical protein NTY93_02340 [Candidatus Kaiserbacteria bacterium]|nr:hypothetical protein [Candidatus Kaiserbacteria bacterium]